MTAAPAATMRDLEPGHAELLPGRETLPGGASTAQAGLLNVAVANGSFNNILSFGSGNIYA
jgi:hypothetical protein